MLNTFDTSHVVLGLYCTGLMLNTFDTSHVVLGLYCTGLMLKYPFITLEIKFDLLHEATPKYGTVCISILLWVFNTE
jgi:hypothetical protein